MAYNMAICNKSLAERSPQLGDMPPRESYRHHLMHVCRKLL